MKKIIFLSLFAGIIAFASCDPKEDDTKSQIKVLTADQIEADVKVENINGKNVNKVIISNHTPLPSQISNGVNNVAASYAELLLFNTGESTITIYGLNPDGTEISKDYKVTVDEMYYDVPKEYAILTGGTSKTWTWDTELNGGAWGNFGYRGDTGENFALNGSGTWWSCPPSDLSGQLNHSSSGIATGEEDPNAYMVWSLNGTKIETFTPSGQLVRQGKFSLDNYGTMIEDWSVGTLSTTAESILFPWKINSGGYAPTDFQVILLDENKMVLTYIDDPANAGGWSEATFWRFKAK